MNKFKAIIMQLKELVFDSGNAWKQIKDQDITLTGLLKKEAFLMASIPSVCAIIGWSIVGIYIPFSRLQPVVRLHFGSALFLAVIMLVLSLGAIYGYAKLLSVIGKKFDTEVKEIEGIKLGFYSFYVYFVFGIFFAIPMLSVLAILAGLYSLYLNYTGLSIILSVPEAKKGQFSVLSTVSLFLIYIILVNIVYAIFNAFGPNVRIL